MILNPNHSLVLGALDLLGYPDAPEGYWFEATAEGTDFGNPEALLKEITSFLMQGAIEAVEGHNNREMTLRIAVNATTSNNLALAEAALFAEAEKRNILTWTPPEEDPFTAEACVFDVVTSTLSFAFDDINELHRQRIYTLTIKALPFAHAENTITVVSDPPPTTTPVATPVDDCSSLTGWAASSSYSAASLALEGGVVVRAIDSYPKSTVTRGLSLTRTGLAQSMTGTPFVRINSWALTTAGASSQSMSVQINGVATTPVARDGNYSWYICPSGTLTSVQVVAYAKFLTVTGSIFLRVDDIYRTDSTTLATTAGQRQTTRSLPVAGSAPAQGNLTITDTNVTPASLGSVIVHTTPSGLEGFQPNLRRWLQAGPTETPDSALVSGKSSPLSTQHWFSFTPPPSGSYLLVARIKHASAATYPITWTGQTKVGSNVVGTDQTGVQSVALAANVWTVAPIAQMVLPTTQVDTTPGLGAATVVGLLGPSGVLIDEAWLFDVDNGRLTMVECGTGAPAPGGDSSVLQMNAATVANPSPSILRGDPTGAMYGAGATAQAFGQHEFVPPSMNVFLVTTNSVDAEVTGRYAATFFTHVAATE